MRKLLEGFLVLGILPEMTVAAILACTFPFWAIVIVTRLFPVEQPTPRAPEEQGDTTPWPKGELLKADEFSFVLWQSGDPGFQPVQAAVKQ